MVRLEFSIAIERAVTDVYAVVSELENDVKWQRAVQEVRKVTPGPIGPGSRYRHMLDILGKRVSVDVEILEHEPSHGYVLRCRSTPFDFDTRVRLTSMPLPRGGSGTRLDTLVEGHPTGVARIAAVALSRHRSTEIDRDLATLKRLMESGTL